MQERFEETEVWKANKALEEEARRIEEAKEEMHPDDKAFADYDITSNTTVSDYFAHRYK